MRAETHGTFPTHPTLAPPEPLGGPRLDDLEQRARAMDRQARAFIREHPASAVLAAVAVGFVVGRLVRS